MADPAIAVQGLSVRFDASAPWPVRMVTRQARRAVHAVEEVAFAVARGTTFALVGESGCGKSTVARSLAGIQRPTAGAVTVLGRPAGHASVRRHVQMVFQDPHSSLDPSWRVGRIVAEPIVTHRLLRGRRAVAERVAALLEVVGLTADDAGRRPHQFSGGQRQRIAIARALASDPAVVICDEPTSALDVSVQAQVINLLRGLQERFGLTYVLISHDLAVVAQMADRIAVMYLGRLVEQGDAAALLRAPLHPYTRMLLRIAGGDAAALPVGEPPSPLDPPPGCAFHPRCAYAAERCRVERPLPLAAHGALVACHAVEEARLPPMEETAA